MKKKLLCAFLSACMFLSTTGTNISATERASTGSKAATSFKLNGPKGEITAVNGVYTVKDSGIYTLSGKLTSGRIGVQANDVKLKMNGVSVTTTDASPLSIINGVTCTVELLTGTTNTFDATGASSYAAISVENSKNYLSSIVFEGEGTLIANGGKFSAGIGGNADRAGGNITINSGTILAQGGEWGAALGDGDTDSAHQWTLVKDDTGSTRVICQKAKIEINGGYVRAIGTIDTPGIGSSDKLSGESCPKELQGQPWKGLEIVINAGTVVAVGGKPSQYCDGPITAIGAGSGTLMPAENIVINKGGDTRVVAVSRTGGGYAIHNSGMTDGQATPKINANSSANVFSLRLSNILGKDNATTTFSDPANITFSEWKDTAWSKINGFPNTQLAELNTILGASNAKIGALSVVVPDGSYKVDDKDKTLADVDISGGGLTYGDASAPLYTLSLDLQKDDAAWKNSGKEFVVTTHGKKDYSSAFAVKNGFYDIYEVITVDGKSTYVKVADNLEINDARKSVTVDYYSVNLTKDKGILSISGAGAYLKGSKVTLDATLSSNGYTWNKWVGSNGSTDITSKNNEITVNGKHTYMATTTANTYVATFDAKEGTFGNSIKIEMLDQTYDTKVKLPSTNPTRPGYNFDGWVDNSNNPIDNNSIFSDTTDVTYAAKWVEKGKAIFNYSVNDATMGFVSSTNEEGNCEIGSFTGSTATANIGYRFVKWIKKGDTTGASVSDVKLLEPQKNDNGSYESQDYEAIFEADTHIITSMVNGSGGSISPAGNSTVAYDGSITYNFTPVEGYEVKSITIDNVTTPTSGTSYTFHNVTAQHVISVTFGKKVFPITITIDGNGKANSAGDTSVNIEYGDTKEFTFLPDPGYMVTEVKVDDVKQNNLTSYTFTNVNQGHRLYIKFEKIQNIANIKVNKDGAPWLGQNVCLKLTNASQGDSTISLTEKDNGNYQGNVTKGIYDIYVNDEKTGKTITMTDVENDPQSKTLNYATLNVSKGANVTSVPNGGIYLEGTSITLDKKDIQIDAGYSFDKWTSSIAGILTDTSTLSQTFTMPKQALTLTVKAKANIYVATFDAKEGSFTNSEHTMTLDQTYDVKVNLPTNPKRPGYNFDGWLDSSNNLINEDTIFNATTNVTYTAKWVEKNKAIFNYSVNDETMGSVSVLNEEGNCETGTFNGTTAQPKLGYHFVKWIEKDDEDEISVGNDLLFKPSKHDGVYTSGNYVAVFAINTYKINAMVTEGVDGIGGTISPSGEHSVDYGQNKTYTFTPNTGYKVKSITIDGIPTPTNDTTYTFTNVTDKHEISVTFEKIQYAINITKQGNGTVTKDNATSVNVKYDENKTFTFTPDKGWKVSEVLVDGKTQTNLKEYTFLNVKETHTLSVKFEEITNNVNITLNKDETPWKDQDVKLKSTNASESDSFITLTENSDGNYDVDVKKGTYDIYVNGEKTGKTVTITDVENEPKTKEINYATLTVEKGSKVTNAPKGGIYLEGTSVTLNGNDIEIVTGYSFDKWSSSLAGILTDTSTPSQTFTMTDEALTLTVKAKANKHNATFDAGEGEFVDGDKTKDQEQTFDEKVSMPKDPVKPGYDFDGWYDETGNEVSQDTIFTTDHDVNYHAKWTEKEKAVINYSVNNASMGHVSVPSETGNPETSIFTGTIAIANEGYHFVKWIVKDDSTGTNVSDNATFVPTKNDKGLYVSKDYVAVFAIDTYKVNANVIEGVDGIGGTITPNGESIVDHNASITYTMKPNVGYEVKSIIIDGITTETQNTTYTFANVTQKHAISVTFGKKEFPINVTTQGSGSVTKDRSNIVMVKYDESQGFVFTPANGWKVSEVNVDGNKQNELGGYTFHNVQASHDLFVKFEEITNTVSVNVRKDNVAWIKQDVSLKPVGAIESDPEITLKEETEGLYCADVTKGTYDIYVNGKKTGKTIEITGVANEPKEATLTYFTLSVEKNDHITKVPNGGIYLAGTSITFNKEDTAIASGYSFDKWSSNVSGVLKDITKQAQTFIMPTATLFISANAVANKHTATFDTGEGTFTNGDNKQDIQQTFDQNVNVPTTKPNRPGYDFAGWIDSKGNLITNNTTFKNDEDITYTAQWNEKGKVTFSYGVNDSSMGSLTLTSETGNPEIGEFKGTTAKANKGYHFVKWIVADSSDETIVSKNETFVPAKKDGVYAGGKFMAVFEINTYRIEADVVEGVDGIGGSIKTIATSDVTFGSKPSYTFIPKDGYKIVEVLVDGKPIKFDNESIYTYTFDAVDAKHTLQVKFEKIQYTIQAQAKENGTISDAGTTSVRHGDKKTYTIIANHGYEVKSIVIDGKEVEVVSEYTFEDVKAKHTIVVEFKRKQYTINSSISGNGGSIDIIGDTKILYGDDQTYVITPEEGYEIDQVYIDGKPAGTKSTYTFKNVEGQHFIVASFKKKTFEITPSIDGEGSITSNDGNNDYTYGESKTYHFVPKPGYKIKDVIVDGVRIGPKDSYTFEDMKEGHTISVEFEKIENANQSNNSSDVNTGDETNTVWFYSAVAAMLVSAFAWITRRKYKKD